MLEINYKTFTLSRIDAFVKQIDLLSETDFPYKDSLDALVELLKRTRHLRETIELSVLGSSGLLSKCASANSLISRFHPFLGCLKKSADPINSFEIYFSFRRLAQEIFGPDAKLIISSEWSYTPSNFIIPTELKNFLFIGLPIAESANPLIVPLSGHELGHSVWSNFGFEDTYWMKAQTKLLADCGDLEDQEVEYVARIALAKSAEYFCDFIGIGLFGESYLYSYAYLLSPKITRTNNDSHPNGVKRSEAMSIASKAMGFDVPVNFEQLFKSLPATNSNRAEVLLERSETLAFGLVNDLVEDVKKFLVSKEVLYTKSPSYDEIKRDFSEMIPTSEGSTLADIINAAWSIYFDKNKWSTVKENIKLDLLKEVTTKSFEILEFKQRLQKVE